MILNEVYKYIHAHTHVFFFCFVKLIRHAYESESLFQFKINILYKNKTENKILIKYKSLYQNEQKE